MKAIEVIKKMKKKKKDWVTGLRHSNTLWQIGISRLVEYFGIKESLLQNMSAVSSFSGLLDWLPSPSHLMDRMMEVRGHIYGQHRSHKL